MIRHIHPIGDVFPHDIEHQGKCECEPEAQVLKDGDTLFIHHAWDGRELIEALERGEQLV